MKRTAEEIGINEKIMGLIKLRAYSFNRSTGVPIDELTSEGMLIYVECLSRYREDNEEGASFYSYLFTMLTSRFINFTKTYYKQVPCFYTELSNFDHVPDSDEYEGEYTNKPHILFPHIDEIAYRLIELRQELAKLSPEAQGVVALLENCANELIAMQNVRTKNPHDKRNIVGPLKRMLRNMGWKTSAINRTFNELALAINSL